MAKFVFAMCALAMCAFISVSGTDLQVGTSINGSLAYTENVYLKSIPWKTRTKNVFYNGFSVIKGILAKDNSGGTAQATITSGGVGFTFVNIRLKSESSQKLDYNIQIFV